MVAAVPLQHGLHHLGVGDPVVQNLVPGQVIVIDPDAVQVNGGIPGTNGNIHRHTLSEVIVCRVLHHTGHDAIDVAVDEPVDGFLLHHKGQAQVLVLLVPGGDLLLLGAKSRQLRRDGDTAIAAHAGQHHSIVVHNIPGGKFDLDGLAGGTEVLPEGLHRNGQSGIAGHPENGDIVLIQLPAVRGEVETREAGDNRAILPDSRILFGVAPTGTGQVQRQPLGFRFNFHLAGSHRQRNGAGSTAAGDFQSQIPGVVCPVRPNLLSAIHRLAGHHTAVHRQFHLGGQVRGVVDRKRNGQRGILGHRAILKAGGDDGRGVQALHADDLIIQMIGLDGLPIDGGIKVGFQRMRSVLLGGNRVGHLPAAGGGGHRGDLLAVQQDVNRLADGTHRHIGKGDNPIEGSPGVKGGTHGRFDGVDIEIDGAAVLIGVGHLNPHRIAAHREIRPQIGGYRALGDVQHGLDDAVYRDLHHAVAGGHLILQRGPCDLNETILAVGDGLTQPAAGVGDRQHGVIAAGTAGAARAGEGAEGTSHHFIVGGQIQIAVFHEGSVHLPGEQQFHIGKTLLHILGGGHGKLRVPGGIEGFILGVLCSGQGFAGAALCRPGDGLGVISGLDRILGSRNNFLPDIQHLLGGILHGLLQSGHVLVFLMNFLNAGYESVLDIHAEAGCQESLQFFL